MYMLLFHCRAVGGELTCHPLECADVGWFGPDDLPAATAGAQWWAPMAFAAIRGDELPTHFDPYLKGLVRGRTVVRIGSDTHP